MKTLDEVINAFSEVNKEVGCGDCQFNDADSDDIPREMTDCFFNDALHYLKEYQSNKDEIDSTRLAYLDVLTDYVALKQYWAEQQANPPLTWDELKTMEGKPVWVECKYFICPHWVILTNVYDEKAMFIGDRIVDSELKEEMGDVWQAYRKER